METVDVLLSGHTLPGADVRAAAADLSSLAGLSPEKAQELISSGKPRLVKRGLSASEGQAYLDKFTAMGIEATLRPSAPAAVSVVPATSAADHAQTEQAEPVAASSGELSAAPSVAPISTPPHVEQAEPVLPAASSPKNNSHEEPINPYSAPKADLDSYRPGQISSWRESGAKVPASHGYRWFKDGWSLFNSRKLTWTLAILMVFGLSIAVTSFLPPLIGNIISVFIWPLFGGGMAIMAHRLSEGEAIGVFDIFSGIRQYPVQLLLIGLLIFVYVVIVFALGFLLVGQDTFMALASGQQSPELVQQGGKIVLAFLAVMILMFPVMLGGTFAPTLVALAGESAFAALYKGVLAGLKNWSAFLVNGLVLLLISGGVGMVAGLMIGLGGALSGGSMTVIVLLGLLALLLFIPFFGALYLMPYTTSRDVFYDEA